MDELPGAAPEELICRICFTGECDEPDGEDLSTGLNPLIAPCGCIGSQKYVHIECLKKWQRSVQVQQLQQYNALTSGTSSSSREARHLQCSVCRQAFSIAPMDRAAVMSDLAHVGIDDIAPGLLLVTSRSRESHAVLQTAPGINLALRAYVEAKAAHFREAVYIITDVCRGDTDSSADDSVFGTNLTRTLEISDVSALQGAADEETIRRCANNGVEVRWMNGGPAKPRSVTGLLCLNYLCRSRIRELCELYDLSAFDDVRRPSTEEASDEVAVAAPVANVVLRGALPGLLTAAEEEAAAACRVNSSASSSLGIDPRTGARRRVVTVLAWAGMVQWTRSQLLGDIARGCWGWCHASPEDIRRCSESPEATQRLWGSLRYSDRVQWAPENEMSRPHDRRPRPQPLSRASRLVRAVSAWRRPASSQRAQQADDALDAFVRQFEALRRTGSGVGATRLQPFQPPNVEQRGSRVRGSSTPPTVTIAVLRAPRNGRASRQSSRPCVQQ